MKKMFLRNMRQVDYFIKNGLKPIGATFENNTAIIIFNRDEDCEKIFSSWINSKKINYHR